MKNPFFKNRGPFKIKSLLEELNLDNSNFTIDESIIDIKDLVISSKNHLTFFHSKKYHREASVTKASYCVTFKNLIEYLPKSCKTICVENVLLTMSEITSKFYPESINDDFDNTVKEIEKIILPFLYNLQKTDEPYIHWPNRGPIIKAQIEKLLKLTRG